MRGSHSEGERGQRGGVGEAALERKARGKGPSVGSITGPLGSPGTEKEGIPLIEPNLC